MNERLVILLHLCDSLFPLGSFAHSDGLEAATAAGDIQSASDLRRWMEVALRQGIRRVDGLAVARAWTAFREQRFADLAAIDEEVFALRPTSVGREATRAMGTRLLKTWQQIHAEQSTHFLRLPRFQVTLPVAFGVVAAVAAVPVRAAVEGFAYTRLAAIVSSAMRLMAIGQHDGHRLLSEMLAHVPSVANDVLADVGPLTSFTPAMDIAAMSHQYLESRLFKS